MPNLFIVENQRNGAAIAARLLPTRTSAANRRAALDALRLANPTLDLNRLRPGAVVVVPPEVGRLRRNTAEDPAGDTADDVVAEAHAGLDALVTAAKEAEEQAAAEREETRQLLRSRALGRLAGEAPLEANVETLKQSLAEEDEGSDERLAAVSEAVDAWDADLKALRGLL